MKRNRFENVKTLAAFVLGTHRQPGIRTPAALVRLLESAQAELNMHDDRANDRQYELWLALKKEDGSRFHTVFE